MRAGSAGSAAVARMTGLVALLAAGWAPAFGAAGEYAPPEKAKALEQLQTGVIEALRGGGAQGFEVWLTVFGEKQRGTLVKADAKQITVKLQGTAVEMAWEKLTPEQVAGVGRGVVGEDGPRALALADYCLALGLREKADEALTLAARLNPGLGAALGERLKYLESTKPAAAKPVAATKAETPAAAATTGASAKPAVPAVWRPFAPDSPWNMKIAADAEVDPKSGELIEDLATCCKYAHLFVNIKGFSIPAFFIDSTQTKKYEVKVKGVVGEGFGKPVPIPDSAAPDAKSDGHLCIVDRRLNMSWDMFQGHKEADGSWSCTLGAAMDLSGSGVRPAHTKAKPWQLAHGCRAAGFALIAGLITVDEVKAGRIEHALILAYPHCRSRYYVSPASTAQGTTTADAAQPNRGIPMGGRVQLDPSIAVETLPLSKTGKTIARALQEYGAYVGDYSGCLSLYAVGSVEAQKEWDRGLLNSDEMRKVFDPAMMKRFRVLKMPEFNDNKN
jgi:hypothetical protein